MLNSSFDNLSSKCKTILSTKIIAFACQQRNGLFTWSLNTAEGVIFAAVETVRPAVKIIEGPLQRIDQILCNSLDIVEQRVPSVYLPPQMVSLTNIYYYYLYEYSGFFSF